MMQIFYIFLALITGLILFWLIAMLLIGGEQESKYQTLESEIGARQMARMNIKIRLLYSIGKPDQLNGDYSPEKKKLWAQYNELDAEDQRLRRQEWEQLSRL